MASIQGVYVALFGRPADPTGLAYFNGVTKNGADLSGIGDLASTQEYKDRFAGQSNLAIVNSIYQSLFNRDAEAAGLNFFVDALNKGTLNIKNIAIAILDGAQGTDKTIVTNKVTAADNFTKALDTPVEIAAYSGNAAAAAGRAFLQPVNAATSSIPTSAATDAAIVAIQSVATGGVTLTVATTDVVSTTATDAKFKTTGGDDTIKVTAPAADVTSLAKIDGGFGNDTVALSTDGKKIGVAGTPVAVEYTSVEKLVLTSKGAANAGLIELDLDKSSSIKSVLVDGADASTVKVTNIAAGATLGFKGTITENVSLGFKEAATGTTSVTLEKVDATTATKTVTIANGADTIALSTTGGSKVGAFEAGASLKTLNISGSGDLALALGATTTKVATVDASSLSGKLDLNLTGDTVGVKVTGTNFADTIKLAAAGTADTVVYKKADASNYGLAEEVKTFAKAEDKLDFKDFGFTKTGVATLTNITDGSAVFGTSSVAVYAVSATEAWVFADKNGDGVLNLGTDFAVHLTGGTAVNTLDATNFVLS